MTPVNKRIVVFPDPIKTVSEGGIAIPEKHADAPNSGKVILSALEEYPPRIRIHYFAYSATPIRLNLDGSEKEYVIVPEAEILLKE